MEKNNNIELRSDEVQEIIGSVPNGIIRYGIGTLAIIITILLLSSFYFKYPDSIDARLTLTGEMPPVEVKARLNAKLIQLNVTDNEIVELNCILGVLESTANYRHVFRLKQEVDSLKKIKIQDIKNYCLPTNLQLGDIQHFYSKLQKELTEYAEFNKFNYANKKELQLKKQLSVYVKKTDDLLKRILIVKEDFGLAQKQFRRDSVLFNSGVISELQFENAQSLFLDKQLKLETNYNELSNAQIQIYNLEQAILDIQMQDVVNKQKFETTLNETINNLDAEILQWEQSYVLRTPITGKISFSNYRAINQNCINGETIFIVLPIESANLIGNAKISIKGAGKVKVGQKVNIQFDDYPTYEFGVVKGLVEEIATTRTDDFYSIKVSFPDSLTTSYKKKLLYKQNMQANAQIITEDIPLIVRIVSPLKHIFYKNKN